MPQTGPAVLLLSLKLFYSLKSWIIQTNPFKRLSPMPGFALRAEIWGSPYNGAAQGRVIGNKGDPVVPKGPVNFRENVIIYKIDTSAGGELARQRQGFYSFQLIIWLSCGPPSHSLGWAPMIVCRFRS